MSRIVRSDQSDSRIRRARSLRAPRLGALVPLLAVLGGACDAPGASDRGAAPPAAQIAAINVNPGQTVPTTIRIDGLAWKASGSNEIVSALPVFMVRAEGAGQRFQVVEQLSQGCDTMADIGAAIAPAAASWKAASDPDGYQTITTGEGVRHFCAFLRDVTTKATTATAFDVNVAPTAKFPYSATDFTLAEEPSVQGTYSVPAGANANVSVRFIAGFGMRNSGRWSSQTAAPAATPYDAQVVVPAGWPANTVSFKPPTGTTATLANWEKFGLNYVKTAGTESKLRLFGADIATRGFEPLATLMTKLGHLSAWQLYRLDSLFRAASNLVAANSPTKWQGFLNGIPDWRGFRRWRDLLWASVEGSAIGPRMYFGRTWLAPAVEFVGVPNLPPIANGLMPGLTLDAAGMAFWATFKFPQTIGSVNAQLPDGERVVNPFTRSAPIQEKAIRLALVTTLYEGLTLARSIRLSAADADPANECRTDEYIGPHLQTMFKAIDTLLPSLIGNSEFEGTIPALKAMTQYFLEYLVSLPVAGGGGTNMCLPEVAAAYYAARWNPSDTYWRYLRDVREHAVYERVYPGIYYHEHASFGLEASYEGNANARNVELCSVFKSPLA